ncbi:MAG TPA: hypothetical protein VF828_03305 [Patescibacteria group bacterium]
MDKPKTPRLRGTIYKADDNPKKNDDTAVKINQKLDDVSQKIAEKIRGEKPENKDK